MLFQPLKSITVFTIAALFIYSCNSTPTPSESNTENHVYTPVNKYSSIENLLKQDSLNIDLRNTLANNYYVDKNFDKAIYHFMVVYNIDNKNLTALQGLGNIYYDIQQNNNAIEYYQKYLNINNNNTNVRCDMATCYLNTNQDDKAIELLKQNIEIDNQHAQSHHNLSIAYAKIGNTKLAENEMAIFNRLKSSN